MAHLPMCFETVKCDNLVERRFAPAAGPTTCVVVGRFVRVGRRLLQAAGNISRRRYNSAEGEKSVRMSVANAMSLAPRVRCEAIGAVENETWASASRRCFRDKMARRFSVSRAAVVHCAW